MDVLLILDYDPFGMITTDRNWGNEEYRYGAQGQEKVDEISGSGNHYTALFWEMDPRLGRRWNQDPKPNPSISNYEIFNDNPIWNIDILGDTAFRFDSQGEFLEIYNDGKKDWSIQTMKTITVKEKGEDVQKSVVDQTYAFNDSDKDVADMKYLTTKYGNSVPLLYVKTSEDLRGYVTQSGVWSNEAQDSPTNYAYDQSQQGGKMDNWAQYLGPEMMKQGIDVNDINADRGGFYVYKGVNKAYNAMDFGNALWGLEMMHLDFSLNSAKAAAHGHHVFIARTRHRQGGVLDAPGDQRAIEDGYNKFNTGGAGGSW